MEPPSPSPEPAEPLQAFWDEDRLSWEDSERFEEDSLCSWLSEPESLCQNWRGWSARGATAATGLPASLSYTGGIPSTSNADVASNTRTVATCTGVRSLVDIAAQTVSGHSSFEEVEQFGFQRLGTSFPEALLLRIAYFCFPSSEDDIRLYCCLANGNADEFQRGENLYRSKAVKDPLQIGFHLSATVSSPVIPVRTSASAPSQNVAVTVDRCRITSCVCTCNTSASWCCHVVAVCLHRIHQPDSVKFRAPVSESLNHLNEQQLRKFAQYLISDLSREILPTAQRLLDELLCASSQKNSLNGAPDPTAGASKDDPASWCLDAHKLHDNIKKILIKFCVPSPTVFSDVNYLCSNQPPVANEWQSLLRPLRGREPEGLWNLLSIVREMYRRHDSNASILLNIITEECLSCDQVLIWWYQTKLSQSGSCAVAALPSSKSGLAASQHNAQYSCASLCDEIVFLWRLTALDPALSQAERQHCAKHLRSYHRRVVERVWKILGASSPTENGAPAPITGAPSFGKLTTENARFDLDSFPGFLSALEACQLTWQDFTVEDLVPRSCLLLPRNDDDGELSVQVSSAIDSRSPFSPNLPILREKHFKTVLKASSSCETITANNQKPPEVGSPESGQESDGSPARKHEFSAQGSVESAIGGEEEAEQPGPSGVNLNEGRDEVEALYMPLPVEETPVVVKPKQLNKSPGMEIEQLLMAVKAPEDMLEISFSRCEALYAHGYGEQACQLAVQLAYELIENPPDLMAAMPASVPAPVLLTPTKSGANGKRRKKANAEVPLLAHPKAIRLSRLASDTLQRAIFLFEVLLKELQYHQLAFRVALFALELPRQPASTKFLEVKMNYQESEIVSLLKRIELGAPEMEIVREKAQRLRAGSKATTHVFPFALAHYLFEALCCAPAKIKLPGDEPLGFESSIAALGVKCTVSEAQHPLLCEGSRRQRGELALALLLRYRDQQEKIALIMDRLLDSEMHVMYRNRPSNAWFFSPNLPKQVPILPLAAVAAPLERSLSGVSQGSMGLEELLETDSAHENDTEVSAISSLMDERLVLHDIREDRSPVITSRRSTDEGTDSRIVSREPSPKNYCTPPSDAASDSSSGNSRWRNEMAENAMQQPATLPLRCSSPNRQASQAKNPDPMAKGYKVNRYRKHVTPCVPNQPSEAHAHYMTELAKRLLTEAGGNHSTAIFNAPQNGAQPNQQHGPHRSLHLCAFQIGLYALGLHNKVTPNWLSRTYSSHVSWISGQATEIGRTALRILIEAWENHLTPTEVANLADKASQCREPGMVQAASELALSALPSAHALNPTEIQRALAQCRDQNGNMLERACLAVEQAAKDGGVYPEVLFMVAKKWNDLYNDPDGAQGEDTNPMMAVRQVAPVHMEQQQQHPAPMQQAMMPMQMMSPMVVDLASASGAPILMPPVSLAQGPLPMYPVPTTMAGPFPGNFPGQQNMYPPFMCQQIRPGMYLLPPPNQQLCVLGGPRPLHTSHSAPNLTPHLQHHHTLRHRHHHHHHHPAPVLHEQMQHGEPERPADSRIRYLYAAYRVGMLAMETMGRRIHDDRSYIKFSQNPPYGDDVRWLFKLSQKLGLFYVQQFCLSASQSVVSPFILWDLWTEAARLFPTPPPNHMNAPMVHHAMMPTVNRAPPQPYGHQLANSAATARLAAAINNAGVATPATHVLQRCLHMFYAAANQKLSHPRFMPSDAEEVCNLVRAAKIAFHQLPEGPMGAHPNGSVLFQDFIQNLRRQKACKKDVWAKVMSAANGP